MALETVVMPQLGESILEGIVVRWLVKHGDHVKVDDPLCEIETEKANTELPSPVEGYVARLVAVLNETVDVGAPLIELSDVQPTGAAPSVQPALPAATPAPTHVPAPAPAPTPALPGTFAPPSPSPNGGAAAWGEHLRAMMPSAPAPQAAPAPAAPPARPDRWVPFGHPDGAQAYRYPKPVPSEHDRVEKFSRRRQIIAEHMVVSHAVSPHVVTVAEVDMTELVRLRDQHKARLRKQDINVTFLAFILKATVEALVEFPGMNAVVGANEIIYKGRINLGCAVETEAGLVVPVLKDANDLNLVGLAKALARLAEKARDNKLEPDDISGGTFTVSNPGLKGNLYGGAIINQPQVGILRMGEIKKRPMVLERDGGDVIAIRQMMYLALSYDHRVIDGVTGNAFLYRVRELLEAANFQL